MENKIWIFCAIFTWKVLGKSDGSWLRGVHSKLGKNDITHYADIYSRQSSFRQLAIYPLKGETEPIVLCKSRYGNGAFAPFANGSLVIPHLQMEFCLIEI